MGFVVEGLGSRGGPLRIWDLGFGFWGNSTPNMRTLFGI